MARKNVLTFNGVATTTKNWQKLTLSGKLGEHFAALQEARKAFEQELIATLKSRIKINEAKHEIKLGFRFGPSYIVCDKEDDVAPKGTMVL